MKDVLAIHASVCPNHARQRVKAQLSLDGVGECLSTNVSLDVYSIKFEGCKQVYPIRIIKPLKKVNLDLYQQLNDVLDDLYINQVQITQFIGDNPKRSFVRKCLCFSSWYPCEYCFTKGTKIITNSAESKKNRERLSLQKDIVQEKINIVKNTGTQSELYKLKKLEKDLTVSQSKIKVKKSHIVWPKTSRNGPPRTRQEIMNIIEKIENDVELSIDEAKGIAGRSPFIDLPLFNFVNDIPVDYLHFGCLGVIKRCVELTFKVGESRTRITKRKLSLPSQFNTLIRLIKVPFEFNRRIRDLDFSVYKGQEFRNLLLFFFPLILNCIEEGAKERQLWLNLAYLIRACIIPTEEFKCVPLPVVEKCSSSFYSLYQQLFGVLNCTYNTHLVGSHIIEIRYHGPLTLTSSFPFESFYGELRNSFVPGTNSTLKQMISNVMMKRVINDHKCKNEMKISPKNTPLECNNLIYCYERRTYHMYLVNSMDGNTLTCQTIEKKKCSFPETPRLNWDIVGVFEKGDILQDVVIINKENVKGKLLLVDKYLITCPMNVLLEK